MELRETIDSLRTKNEEAQAVIHGALNNPETSKGLSVFPQDTCGPLFFLWPTSLNFAPFHISLSKQTCESDGRTPVRAFPV